MKNVNFGLYHNRLPSLSKSLLDFLTNRSESANWTIQDPKYTNPKINRMDISIE